MVENRYTYEHNYKLAGRTLHQPVVLTVFSACTLNCRIHFQRILVNYKHLRKQRVKNLKPDINTGRLECSVLLNYNHIFC